jgi:DNA-binding MarR family transcriptional regulator
VRTARNQPVPLPRRRSGRETKEKEINLDDGKYIMEKITEGSMKVLAFIYKNHKTNSHQILKESGFEKEYINRCVDFLLEEGLISKPLKMIDGNRKNLKCTSNGTKLIESPKESKERKDLIINFNIDSIFKADFESLIKLDSVFRGSLFGI